jgi:hypothetical protein
MRVDWKSDPGVSLPSCETYGWTRAQSEVPDPWRDSLDPLLALIEAGVHAQLAEYGLRRVEAAPDLRVRGHLLVERKVTRTTLSSFDDPHLGGRRGDPVEHEFVFEEGSIVIDVLPRDRDAVAWRGWAQAEVVADRDPAERRARVQQAVRRILERFPCRPSGSR